MIAAEFGVESFFLILIFGGEPPAPGIYISHD